jgi:hypothetical protein
MKLSRIVGNAKIEEEGEWRDHPSFDGVEILVRSIHCQDYRKRRAKLMNRLPQMRRKLGDAVLTQEEIDRQALPECLLGWRGIEDEAGKAVEYSKDLARTWAADPTYRKFWEGVLELANEVGEAHAEAVEQTAQD